MSRKEVGKILSGFEYSIDTLIEGLDEYIKKSKESLITTAQNTNSNIRIKRKQQKNKKTKKQQGNGNWKKSN